MIRSFDRLLIGGQWTPPSSGEVIEVVSPTSEQVIAAVPAAATADVDAAVAAARWAFDDGPWPRMSGDERAAVLRPVGEEVAAPIPEMEVAFTAEIGAPGALSTAAHALATATWNDAATLHERLPAREERPWEGGSATVYREPVGVVAVIIPWNGPVATASLKIAPALAAGCTVVLKLAPEGPVSAMILAEALEAAGFPEGVVSVLPAYDEESEHLVRHPDVDMVSFTGSTAVGRRIMAICAETVKRVTLELGGKSAGILLEDVDLDAALPSLLGMGVGHSGQVCAAITRLLVPRSRYDEVVETCAAMLGGMTVGDPSDPSTVLGPLVTIGQRDRVEGYIASGREQGARLVIGGGRTEGRERGWYVDPTLFADVDNSMTIAQEEIFGPVLVAIPYDDVDDAVRIANESAYGLSGSVWSADQERAEGVARRIRTGQIFVNTAGMTVTMPFGGFKQSGFGREGGVEGFSAFLETKTILRS